MKPSQPNSAPSGFRTFFATLKALFTYFYDAKRLIQSTRSSKQENYLRALTIDYHVIEKGLTMENRRYRFGKPMVLRLKRNTLTVIDSSDFQACTQFKSAVDALCDYYEVHQEQGEEIDDIISADEYGLLKAKQPSPRPAHEKTTANDFFRDVENTPFEAFAHSRHSARSFTSETIPLKTIEEVIQLANTAPSVCNRQTARVHLFQNTEKVQLLLALQNGNTGFGHTIHNLAIITSDLKYFVGINERNQSFIDGGIYLMNFLYALHHHKIGAIALNWAAMPDRDKQLRQLADIPPDETVICLVGMGYLKDEFTITASKKLSSNECLFIK